MTFKPAFRTLSTVLGLMCVLALPVLAQNPAKILILPFNINAAEEFAFLREGIYDMLVSRLAAVPEAVVIDRATVEKALQAQPGPVTAAGALNLGESLDADYVLFGSFTLFGDSISTDANFYDLGNQTAVVTFNQTGASRGDLIGHVNQFSDRIKTAAFGLKTAVSPPPAPKAPATAAQPPPAAPVTVQPAPVPAPVGGQSGLSAAPAPLIPFALTKSRRFKIEIESLTVADVDGDKSNELVFIDKNGLHIYRYEDQRFQKVDETKAGRSHRLLSIDAADINANGTAEIFVTSAPPDIYSLNSYVMEWQDGRFERIQKNSGWYFRVAREPARQDVLLGQQRAKREVFLNTKYELGWKADQYSTIKTLPIPARLNIFGLAFGDILADGKSETIAFAPNDHLVILDQAGQEIWTSDSAYGGSTTYLEAEDPEGDRMGEYREKKRVYFPQRIIVSDIDNNGANEIIVVNNEESSGRLLQKTRIFNSGVIECLAWDGREVSVKWKTREFKGYISDYGLGDLDNDGTDELVFALVSKSSGFMSKPRSSVYMMELQ